MIKIIGNIAIGKQNKTIEKRWVSDVLIYRKKEYAEHRFAVAIKTMVMRRTKAHVENE